MKCSGNDLSPMRDWRRRKNERGTQEIIRRKGSLEIKRGSLAVKMVGASRGGKGWRVARRR
jgi:hypothetical protein